MKSEVFLGLSALLVIGLIFAWAGLSGSGNGMQKQLDELQIQNTALVQAFDALGREPRLVARCSANQDAVQDVYRLSQIQDFSLAGIHLMEVGSLEPEQFGESLQVLVNDYPPLAKHLMGGLDGTSPPYWYTRALDGLLAAAMAKVYAPCPAPSGTET